MKNESDFNAWAKSALPSGKKEFTFNRDALEMLLRLAWQEGAKAAEGTRRANAAEDERERKHGPRFI